LDSLAIKRKGVKLIDAIGQHREEQYHPIEERMRRNLLHILYL